MGYNYTILYQKGKDNTYSRMYEDVELPQEHGSIQGGVVWIIIVEYSSPKITIQLIVRS